MFHTCTIWNILIQYYWTTLNSPNSYWFSLGRSLFNIFNFAKSAHFKVPKNGTLARPNPKTETNVSRQHPPKLFLLGSDHRWIKDVYNQTRQFYFPIPWLARCCLLCWNTLLLKMSSFTGVFAFHRRPSCLIFAAAAALIVSRSYVHSEGAMSLKNFNTRWCEQSCPKTGGKVIWLVRGFIFTKTI